MDPSVIIKVDLPITNHKPVNVIVANGHALWTNAVTKACQYSIQSHNFTSDFRVLELQGYDLVLGCDWLFEFSPVGIILKTREFTIEKSREKICFKDETLPNENFLVSHKKMKRILHKGAIGAVVYVQKLHLHQPESPHPPPLQRLLDQFKDVFAEPQNLPPKRDIDHSIPLQPGAEIMNTRPYKLSHSQKDTMEALILQLLKNQVIRPSVSPYSSPAILVKKKDGTWMLCIDYRKLNQLTVKNKFPIPIIEDLLDELQGARVFSKIDLRSGYHQIRMDPNDIPKTAFSTHQGHFEYAVIPFGLTNTPATFQSLMKQVLQKCLRQFVLVLFDDILIYGKSTEEHYNHLQQVLQVLRDNKLFDRPHHL
jgi:hypothetical protein